MDDVWTIIGLSSLIASIVTVVLGLARDVLVDKYRFKRQSEAGYLQSQIQVFSKIYFILTRTIKGATKPLFFKTATASVKEVNDIIEANVLFLTPTIFNEWIDLMVLMQDADDEKDPEKRNTLLHSAREKIDEILKLVADIANNDLIPKYRKIVGQSVAILRGSFET